MPFDVEWTNKVLEFTCKRKDPMKNKRIPVITLLLLVSAAATPVLTARADILGDSIHVNYLYPTSSSVYTSFANATVTPGGAPFDIFGHDTFRVFPSMIIMTNDDSNNHQFTAANFNGFSVDDLTSPGKITGVTIDPASNLAGLDASRIFFSGTTLFVNFQGLTSLPTTYVQLDLVTIPEPGPVTLFLGAFATTFVAAWRRRTKKHCELASLPSNHS
jgi:hypothetical protein